MNASENKRKVARVGSGLRSAFPLDPASLIGLASLIYILALRYGPEWAVAKGIPWFVTRDQAIVVIMGILAMVAGLVLARLLSFTSKQLTHSHLPTIVNNGRLLCYIAIFGYVVWIAVSGNEWLLFKSYGHTQTVPGITTLTQVLPLGLSCLYLGNRFGLGLPKDKWIFISTFLLTILRVFSNNERLALVETYFPLIVIYLVLSPQPRGFRRISRFMVLPIITFGGYAAFAVAEYFRSWTYYRNFYSESYLSFAANRIEAYYITALNNGAVYDTYVSSGRLPFIQLLDFFWKFPIIGQYFAQGLTPDGGYSWGALLKSAVGTDEFNNPSTLLPLSSEATRIGMCIVLFILVFLMSRLHSRMHTGDAMPILIYANLAVGLLEIPLLFWYTQGKTLPVFIALVWLVRNQKRIEQPKKLPFVTSETARGLT